MKKADITSFSWINKPAQFELADDWLSIETEPKTDLWQNTYYGFQNDNAPALLNPIEGDFTFEVKAEFDSKHLYDQCGILMYHDSDNWVKASIEYEDKVISRLGSVVTNLGYSDWASTDIPASVNEIWYRLSRRGQDFYLESSKDGQHFEQMRMLHMHRKFSTVLVGVYACSPLDSCFQANFSNFRIGDCQWKGI